MPLRVGVAAHLVEHRALDRQDAPVGLVLRMRAVERVQGLLVAAVVRERTAIGTEHDTVVPIVDCRLHKHGRGLRPLSNGAQCLGVADGRSRRRSDCRGTVRPRNPSPAATGPVDRGAVSVAIDPVVSGDECRSWSSNRSRLKAARIATEARRRAGGRCIVRKPSTGSETALRAGQVPSNKTLTLTGG